MSKAKPYLIGAALGASAMFFALQYHVVHSRDGFQVVPRTPQQSIGLAYVDVRSWSPSQWTDRPEVARALMAHGSSDLIAESVSSTLADSVTEDSSTLDELRAFLNESRNKAAEEVDDLLSIPRSEASDRSDPARAGRDLLNDVVGIPFPSDAKAESPADPFRVAATANAGIASRNPADDIRSAVKPQTGSSSNPTSSSRSGSRFTADDILDGLGDFTEVETSRPTTNAGASAPSNPSTNRSSVGPSSGSSAIEQSRAMEERIWGMEPAPASSSSASPFRSGANRSGANRSGATGAPGTTKPPSAAESMFEEVTSQLENRAQDALTRAQETTKARLSTAMEDTSRATGGYVREKAQEILPEATRGIIDGLGGSDSILNGFDPFLE